MLLVITAQMAVAAVALGVMYNFTKQTIVGDARAVVDVVQADLVDAYSHQGLAGLQGEVNVLLNQADNRDFVLLVTGPDGKKIAGNIEQWPEAATTAPDWHIVQMQRAGVAQPEQMGVQSTQLRRGYRLVAGQVLESEGRLIGVSGQAFLWALLSGALFSLLMGLALRRLLSSRIDAFAEVAGAVQRGDLTRRIERNKTGDAFDRLGLSINAMLDRIETLIGELRSVTDSMAHDLRTPVSRMKVGLEQALSQTRDRQAEAAIGAVMGEVDLLHRMLNAALQISRAEAGMGRDQFSAFDSRDLLNDLIEVYEPSAEEAGFALVMDCPEPLHVVAHRDLLLMALTNLIDNALNYAKGGTLIQLNGTRSGEWVELAVADNGPGIAVEDRAEALKRFGRLDPSRGTSGAGLGLSLVETIAHLHNGTVDLETRPGGGLQVMLRLSI